MLNEITTSAVFKTAKHICLVERAFIYLILIFGYVFLILVEKIHF